MTLNKSELMAAIAKDLDLPIARVEIVYAGLVKVVQEQVKQGNEVTLPGLAMIKHKFTPARSGRNPSTGQAMEISAKNKITITPAKPLRDATPPVEA